ncbi:ThuA domain-containing protein [Micromonospora sp. MA102]|uniref:ThuA domain-containing protein n=1 Tax=Micromonospora sp. MA102 TaxID=2952755 RepID=UPI0021C6A365|nr:ThuA domain-containing protein [Micromonospora sp. MA102]
MRAVEGGDEEQACSSTPPATSSTPVRRAAFERHVTAGGGNVGVHAAAETEPDWALYQDLVGAKVASTVER